MHFFFTYDHLLYINGEHIDRINKELLMNQEDTFLFFDDKQKNDFLQYGFHIPFNFRRCYLLN